MVRCRVAATCTAAGRRKTAAIECNRHRIKPAPHQTVPQSHRVAKGVVCRLVASAAIPSATGGVLFGCGERVVSPLEQPLQDWDAPPTAGAGPLALAHLANPSRLLQPNELLQPPPSDVKAQAHFVVGLHHASECTAASFGRAVVWKAVAQLRRPPKSGGPFVGTNRGDGWAEYHATMRATFGSATLELRQGDITTQHVDAIVNAANEALAGGGGVDGAIHRAAGPVLMQQTRERYPAGCPTGQAVLTDGGNLAARFVVHTVGPRWHGGQRGEAALLASAIRESLSRAAEAGCESVAVPAISCGVYGYPIDQAAEVSLTAAVDFLESLGDRSNGGLSTVRFVLFSEGVYGAFARAFETLQRTRGRS